MEVVPLVAVVALVVEVIPPVAVVALVVAVVSFVVVVALVVANDRHKWSNFRNQGNNFYQRNNLRN